jgi:hypothetical protein
MGWCAHLRRFALFGLFRSGQTTAFKGCRPENAGPWELTNRINAVLRDSAACAPLGVPRVPCGERLRGHVGMRAATDQHREHCAQLKPR